MNEVKETNLVHKSFKEGKNLKIGDYVIIKEDCQVGDNVTIKDFVRLAKNTKIGNNTVIDSYVRSSGVNKIGNNVTIRYGATIAREVTVEDDVFISPNVMTIYMTHKGKKIGGTVIGKGAFIGTNVILGAGVKIGSAVVVGSLASLNNCIIGDNCSIRRNVVIGSRGLNVKRDEDGYLQWVKSKRKCLVILQNKVDVGTNSVINRGVENDTVIGEGTFIGPKCGVGHDVTIGKNCIIGAMSLICGFVKIGDYSRISPGSTVLNRVKIGYKAFVGIGSLVMHDVPDEEIVVGRPAVDIKTFRERREHLKKLLL